MTGDEIEVTAPDYIAAEKLARKIATDSFIACEYQSEMDLHEICIDNHEIIGDAPLDPSHHEWIRMGDAPHPLPEGTLIFSRQGECDDLHERQTGPCVVGVIDRTFHAPAPQLWAYGVHFESSGVYVTIDAGEYDPHTGCAPDDYLVAIA